MPTKRTRRTRNRRDEGAPDALWFRSGFVFTGDREPADEAEGRRWWPRYRRLAWLQSRVGRIPHAAAEYDGMTGDGYHLLYQWRPVDEVRAALAEDRAALERFQATAAATEIADVLPHFAASLEAIDVVLDEMRDTPFDERLAIIHGLNLGGRNFYHQLLKLPYPMRP